MSTQPFTLNNATITVSASTASASGALTTNGQTSILVSNESTSTGYVRSGIGAQTAVVTDTPVLASTQQTFTIPSNHDTVAVILKSGTGSVYFSMGYGA